jgi:hypothetical protein
MWVVQEIDEKLKPKLGEVLCPKSEVPAAAAATKAHEQNFYPTLCWTLSSLSQLIFTVAVNFLIS